MRPELTPETGSPSQGKQAPARRRAWLHEAGVVEREEAGEDGLVLHLRWTARQKAGFEALDQPTD